MVGPQKKVFLDFEFNGISEAKLNLVSVAAKVYDGAQVVYVRFFWLHRVAPYKVKEARQFFRNLLLQGYVFVSYVMEAEVRGLMALLDGDPLIFSAQYIDLYLEYRCLLNHNHQLAYGVQYIKGEVITTTPPRNKWELVDPEADNEAHHKPSYSLAAAVYKLLDNLKIDTDRKTRVRDIIIKSDPEAIDAAMDAIEAYNRSDIQYLPQLYLAVIQQFMDAGAGAEVWVKGALSRGDYAMRTARMIIHGYPVNQDKLSKFTANVGKILKSAAEDCLAPEYKVAAFRFDKRQQRYVMNEKAVRDWIGAEAKPYWRKTEKEKPSLSKEAFGDWYDSQSEGFAGAFCRYLKTKQSMNGFLPGGKSSFTDFMGTDGRVRPFFGIYGSQSSRSQPGATGFLPLKAHWMRNFLEAPEGYALAGVDYSSQEFLIAAILSQDNAMLAAYESGDVYLAFGKTARIIPEGGTKVTHKKERDLCKALVLGISYDMSAKGLAPRLTQILKRPVTEDQAKDLIETFYDIYGDYGVWKEEVQAEYRDDGNLMLPDGWVMWGDNDNPKSVGNFPVQGHGAVIMREAVRSAQKNGLNVVFTLHDALYIEYKTYDVRAIELLKGCMQEAFVTVMSPYGRIVPIRLEGESWAAAYGIAQPPAVDDIVFMSEYVDEKGAADVERYRKFFTKPPLQGELHNGIQESVRVKKVLQVQRVQPGPETGGGGCVSGP